MIVVFGFLFLAIVVALAGGFVAAWFRFRWWSLLIPALCAILALLVFRGPSPTQ
jgi:hypothetical protein